MALVGPDGNNLPAVLSDGVAAYDWVALRSRIYTAHDREAFAPDFGIGLAEAIGSPTLSQGDIARRIEASLAGETLNVDTVTVQVAGQRYDIALRLEA